MLRNKETDEIIPYDTHTNTITYDAIVNLCDVWFESIDSLEQVTSLIHELSHWYLKTEDHAYAHQTEKYKNLPPKKHRDNADSYAFIVKRAWQLKHSEMGLDT